MRDGRNTCGIAGTGIPVPAWDESNGTGTRKSQDKNGGGLRGKKSRAENIYIARVFLAWPDFEIMPAETYLGGGLVFDDIIYRGRVGRAEVIKQIVPSN